MEIARGQIDIPSAKQEWEIKIGSLPLRVLYPISNAIIMIAENML